MSASRPSVVILGNPENRRVTMFQEALVEAGLPAATVLSWLDVARDPSVLDALPSAPFVLRIESFGESFAVDKLFLARGHAAAASDPTGPTLVAPGVIADLVEDRGLVLAPRQHHHGFLAVLADVERWLVGRPDVRVTTPIGVIRELFDKRATSRTCERLGVPAPRALRDPSLQVGALRKQLIAAKIREAYVKLSCGSSASCLAIWRLGPSRDVVVTTLETTEQGFYNSLRVRRYERPGDVERVLSFLLREGSHVEESVEKALLDGRHSDCRVLVVKGEPAFTVVRTSLHPITNLHLGGQRGDPEALRALCPPAVFEEAMESCRRLGAHYGALHLGVDLLYERGFRGHRVVEANAFGDLLPNLTRDGLGTYGWEIRALFT